MNEQTIECVFSFSLPDDRLVASGGQNQSWPSPHNVEIQLTYPSQGYGAAVSYIAIVVNQVNHELKLR